MDRRKVALLGVVVVIVFATAGCSGLSGVSGPSLSNPHVEMVEDQGPAVYFNYSVSDYSTVLLENPNGDVINEGTLEPEQEVGGIFMMQPQGGTYTIIIQQGGETAVTEEVEFEGPRASVQEVETQWDEGTLSNVSLTIRNSGDLPVYVRHINYSLQTGERFTIYTSQWIAAGQTATVDATPQYGKSIVVNSPGRISPSLKVQTHQQTLTTKFSKTFEGTNLEIVDITDNWNDRELKSVEVRVRNTGDLEAYVEGSVLVVDKKLASGSGTTIRPGGSGTLEFSSLGNIYEITSGGTTEFQVRVSTEYDQVSGHFSRNLQSGNTTLRNISANWANGNLESVIVDAANSGELEDVLSLRVEVNGEKIATQEVMVQAGEQKTINFGQFAPQSLANANSGGTYTVTVINTDTGQTVSDEVTFEGMDLEVTNLTVNSYENFDSNTSEIIGFTFKLRNNGDITLRYDAVRVEVAGESRRDSSLVIGELKPGGSTTEVLSFDSNIVVDSGTHNLTIELLRDNDVVAAGSSDLSI